MAAATPPARRGPDAAEAARRIARAGRAAIRRQHPSSPRARRRRSLPRCGELTFRTPTRHRARTGNLGRILIPGDGAAGDQEAQNRPVYATPAACPVSTTSWRYGLRCTCRLVTGRSPRPRSTWPDQARLAFPAVTHRYKRTHCLRLEQFQIAESGVASDGVQNIGRDDRMCAYDAARVKVDLDTIRSADNSINHIACRFSDPPQRWPVPAANPQMSFTYWPVGHGG